MPTYNDQTSPASTDNGHPAPADGPRSSAGPGWLASLRARLGLGPQQTLRETLEEAVRSEASTDATFSTAERDMLLRLLRFGGLRVEDIMVPRPDIVALDDEAPVSELIRLFETAGVSRLPVYHETLDDPRGMVHVKDLLSYLAGTEGWRDGASQATPGPGRGAANANGETGSSRTRSIKSTNLMRPVLNVPPSMSAINLLIRMQATRHHMALVVDEYGGTDGLVTIEDLVEQVVGDIEDEYDVDEAAHIQDDGRQGLVAHARTTIGELEAYLGVRLLAPDEQGEIDTVGGLVVSRAGRVPVKGEVIAHDSGLRFEVLDADTRRVKRLRVHRPPTAEQQPGAADRQGGSRPPAG